MKHTLILGYGNELRRDDGVGPWVARQVEAWDAPGVSARAAHQLLPEMAAEIAAADRVVFVDASVDGEGVRVTEVCPADPKPSSAHAADPARLLGLVRQVYGGCPRAWMVAIPAHDMAFGESFSPAAERGAREALEIIKTLTTQVAP